MYYVVRHILSGAILPNMGRGTTHWDPYGKDPLRRHHRKTAPPRLFTRESDANHFVKWWEEGTWSSTYGEDPELYLKPIPSRRGTLEVVPAELTIILEKT